MRKPVSIAAFCAGLLGVVICGCAWWSEPKPEERPEPELVMIFGGGALLIGLGIAGLVRQGPGTSDVRDLFDRWERVWHEGPYDLIPGCVQPNYIRHDEAGDRTVTREAYAVEIEAARRDRPNNRFVVYDHEITADRAWFRFTLMWNDAATGDPITRAGLQVYRIECGKIAETWLMFQPLGSAWTDAVAQERWTSKLA